MNAPSRKSDPFVPISEPTTGRDVVRALKAVEDASDRTLAAYQGKSWNQIIAVDEYVRKVLAEMRRLEAGDRAAERFINVLHGEES